MDITYFEPKTKCAHLRFALDIPFRYGIRHLKAITLKTNQAANNNLVNKKQSLILSNLKHLVIGVLEMIPIIGIIAAIFDHILHPKPKQIIKSAKDQEDYVSVISCAKTHSDCLPTSALGHIQVNFGNVNIDIRSDQNSFDHNHEQALLMIETNQDLSLDKAHQENAKFWSFLGTDKMHPVINEARSKLNNKKLLFGEVAMVKLPAENIKAPILYTAVPKNADFSSIILSYENALKFADQGKFTAITFSCLGTNSGFTVEQMAELAVGTIRRYCKNKVDSQIQNICILCRNDEEWRAVSSLPAFHRLYNT